MPLPQSVGPIQQFWRNQHGPPCAVEAVFVRRGGGSLLAAGNINAADFSTPPPFFTGPFNYGFSPLGLDSGVRGLVHITDISFSADAVVNFPLVLQNGDLVAFNGEIYLGPSPFGFLPGQVTGSFTEPQTHSGTAPTLLQFSQSDLYTIAPPTEFTGNYDFTANTMTSSSDVILFFADEGKDNSVELTRTAQ